MSRHGEVAQEAGLLEGVEGMEAVAQISQAHRLPKFVAAAVVTGAFWLSLLVGASFLYSGERQRNALPEQGSLRGSLVDSLISEAEAAKALRPRYALVNGSIETLWQRPRGEVKGLFFAAHGCCHQGPDYFSEVEPDGWHFEACRKTISGGCLGLPEEVHFRHIVLSRGYIVMAVSGGDGKGSCWGPRDVRRVKAAIAYVRKEEKLPDSAPVFATGSSSGGALLAPLAQPESQGGLPGLQCIVPMVSVSAETRRQVPTLHVYMTRDAGTAYMAHDTYLDFEADHVRAGEIAAKPLPVTVKFLSRCLDADLGKKVVEALRKEGLVDKDGYLKDDARQREWVKPVKGVIAGKSKDTLVADKSCLSELMNVAWSFHEFTGEFSEAMVDFCEGKWNGTFALKL